jgi:hypothetical protein
MECAETLHFSAADCGKLLELPPKLLKNKVKINRPVCPSFTPPSQNALPKLWNKIQTESAESEVKNERNGEQNGKRSEACRMIKSPRQRMWTASLGSSGESIEASMRLADDDRLGGRAARVPSSRLGVRSPKSRLDIWPSWSLVGSLASRDGAERGRKPPGDAEILGPPAPNPSCFLSDLLSID